MVEAGPIRRRHAYLDEEIIRHTLSCLPTPDLRRCRLVCKDWHTRLIPSLLSRRPDLAFIHIKKLGPYQPRFFSLAPDGSLRRDAFPPPSFPAVFRSDSPLSAQVLAVCSGAVLACTGITPLESSRRCRFRCRPDPRRTVSEVLDYVVLNPITRLVSTVPPPPDTRRYNTHFNFLIFDPRASLRHFKVILTYFLTNPLSYCSKSEQWRPLEASDQQVTIPQSWHPWREGSCCVDGTWYAIVGCSSRTSERPPFECLVWSNILAFDLKKERLFSITSPEVIDGRTGFVEQSIGESAGRLCYAFRAGGTSISIWVLVDGSSGEWSLRHKIDLTHAPHLSGRIFAYALHPSDADLIFVSFTAPLFRRPLFLANLKTFELREFAQGDEFATGTLYPYVCPSFLDPLIDS